MRPSWAVASRSANYFLKNGTSEKPQGDGAAIATATDTGAATVVIALVIVLLFLVVVVVTPLLPPAPSSWSFRLRRRLSKYMRDLR